MSHEVCRRRCEKRWHGLVTCDESAVAPLSLLPLPSLLSVSHSVTSHLSMGVFSWKIVTAHFKGWKSKSFLQVSENTSVYTDTGISCHWRRPWLNPDWISSLPSKLLYLKNSNKKGYMIIIITNKDSSISWGYKSLLAYIPDAWFLFI